MELGCFLIIYVMLSPIKGIKKSTNVMYNKIYKFKELGEGED